jgi:hypothetical protein
MRCTKLALVLLATFLIGSSVAVAQWSPDDPENISRLNVSGGFNYARANAPPADCGCFSLIGGYFSAGYHIKDWLSVEAEVTGGHANNISALGQDLTLLTFAGGVKYQYNGHRWWAERTVATRTSLPRRVARRRLTVWPSRVAAGLIFC